MPIKRSAAAEIAPLIDALRGSDDLQREAAIARLALMGPRAVERLVATYRGAENRETRVAVLRALEGLADRRSVVVARDALKDREEIAAAGAAVLQSLLDSRQEQVAAEALDALMDAALSRSASRATRLAACQALDAVPADVRSRVIAALQSDPDPDIRSRSTPSADLSSDLGWREIADGKLPGDPSVLRRAIAARATTAPLTTLQKLVDALRTREATVSDPLARIEWQLVRGTLHQALARRGSRVALYDLRESLASADSALPVSFLAAIHELGDRSCLEPLAVAYTRVDDAWWRQQIRSAFRTIVRREKLTKRHVVLRRVAKRWPNAAAELTTGSQT